MGRWSCLSTTARTWRRLTTARGAAARWTGTKPSPRPLRHGAGCTKNASRRNHARPEEKGGSRSRHAWKKGREPCSRPRRSMAALEHFASCLFGPRRADLGLDVLDLLRRREHGRQPKGTHPQLPRPAGGVVEVVVLLLFDSLESLLQHRAFL